MSEQFAQLLEESFKKVNLKLGSVLPATVVKIEKDYVTVDAGYKSEGVISIDEFLDDKGSLAVAVGDQVDVALVSIEDGFGETRLSREKAKRAESWTRLDKAHESGEPVLGIISGRVKGGFTVEIDSIRAFLPGSLVDVRPVRDSSYLEGKELEFKVIKMDAKRNNVVVSRRAVVEQENTAEKQALLENLEEDQNIKGVVKNLTDYGAFIDLGGIDGLLHITDMSWKRIKHPSELITVGDEIPVVILKFDKERNRVSLGMKQLGDDPWADITSRYPVNTRLFGKVTNITDYGCFVEIEDGVEGLVHVSEMSWTNKNIHPSKVVQLGDEVEVVVLEIDEDRRRISLGVKQCAENPWQVFAEKFQKDDKVQGAIKSITDFGIFIGLDGGIDGLVHINDISWSTPGESAIREFKKGQEVEAIVLAVDPERERISLGIKQLEEDPYGEYMQSHPKGSLVVGKVTETDAKGAHVELEDGVTGFIRISEIARERVSDVSDYLREGDEVEAKLIGIDRKTRLLSLSIKARDEDDQQASMENQNAGSATLGDLLKEKMSGNDSSGDDASVSDQEDEGSSN